jgi:hypothetical protein
VTKVVSVFVPRFHYFTGFTVYDVKLLFMD